jgi:Spy/CpxP family protein refolding chaperone
MALAAPAIALAQNGAISDSTQPGATSNQTNQPNGQHHHGMYRLLQTLDLSQQQQDQIKALMTSYKQAHPEGSAPDPAARKQLHDQVLSILTPAQRTKLEQEKAAWQKQHQGTPSPSPTQ